MATGIVFLLLFVGYWFGFFLTLYIPYKMCRLLIRHVRPLLDPHIDRVLTESDRVRTLVYALGLYCIAVLAVFALFAMTHFYLSDKLMDLVHYFRSIS